MHVNNLTFGIYFEHYMRTLDEFTVFHPVVLSLVIVAPILAATLALVSERVLRRRMRHCARRHSTNVVLPFKPRVAKKEGAVA